MYFHVHMSFVLRQKRCEKIDKRDQEKKKRNKGGKCSLENCTPGFPPAENWGHRSSAESAGTSLPVLPLGECVSLSEPPGFLTCEMGR